MSMNYNEFIKNLKKMVDHGLGKGLKASFSTVEKNNGKKEESIEFYREGEMLHLTISLENLYGLCMESGDIWLGIQKFLEIADTRGKVEVNDSFWSWERIKGNLSVRLVNYEWNRGRLRKLPYKRFHDLAVTFQIVLHRYGYDTASIEVHNGMMKSWKKNTEELWTVAMNNLFKENFQIRDIDDVIEALAGVRLYEQGEGKAFCYVLTNEVQKYGAVGVFRTDLLMELAERLKQNLYIIPSSVHEILLFSDDGRNEAESLKQIVRQVNTDVVDREELLSNELYYFSREGRVVTMI